LGQRLLEEKEEENFLPVLDSGRVAAAVVLGALRPSQEAFPEDTFLEVKGGCRERRKAVLEEMHPWEEWVESGWTKKGAVREVVEHYVGYRLQLLR